MLAWQNASAKPFALRSAPMFLAIRCRFGHYPPLAGDVLLPRGLSLVASEATLLRVCLHAA